MKFKSFETQILHFNGMYKLPIAPYPATFAVVANERVKGDTQKEVQDKQLLINRVESFQKTLSAEVEEADDICRWLALGKKPIKDASGRATGDYIIYDELEFLTDMADWLGDVVVYCVSEMAKYGIPMKAALGIIMASNFSKLDANGKPIYDKFGKVLKGPGYWKPEPQLRQMLEQAVLESKEPKENGIVWEQSSPN